MKGSERNGKKAGKSRGWQSEGRGRGRSRILLGGGAGWLGGAKKVVEESQLRQVFFRSELINDQIPIRFSRVRGLGKEKVVEIRDWPSTAVHVSRSRTTTFHR